MGQHLSPCPACHVISPHKDMSLHLAPGALPQYSPSLTYPLSLSLSICLSYTHSRVHTGKTHRHSHIFMQPHTRSHTHTLKQTHTYTIHMYAHTHKHKHRQTHTHTHTHTHIGIRTHTASRHCPTRPLQLWVVLVEAVQGPPVIPLTHTHTPPVLLNGATSGPARLELNIQRKE